MVFGKGYPVLYLMWPKLISMNRFFTLLFVASCLTATSQMPDYVPTEGLVAWYPLDGNAVDLSGSNADGILNGPEAALDRFNVESSALAFDGLDDWVGLGDLNPISEGTSGHASFSFWINVESLNASNLQAVLIGDEIYQNNGVLYQLANDYGFGAYVAGSSNWDGYCGCFPILNEWQHVVFVQGENGTDLYLDGQHLVNLLADVFNNETTSPYRIGGFAPVFSSRFFDGRMDDLGIWSRALSVEEIQEVFLATPPFMGCTDESACNYDATATLDDESCLQLDACGECGGDGTSGCIDNYACNYDFTAQCDDGSCDYSCCPGPGCCDSGMYWDWELGMCQIANPSDSNFDGCVQLNDLLDLLSAYGDCEAEESPWQCGDPLEYQGYDYATVLIGDQCWFTENLRSENYENGDAIPAGLSDSEWSTTNSGAVAVFGEDAGCENFSPDIEACDPAQSLEEYGRLYNWYAVDDARGLCPSGWHVPTDGEWTVMTDELGGESIAGGQMKTTYGWYNGGHGTNSSGFSGLPGGFRVSSGFFFSAGVYGYWWSSSPVGSYAWVRYLLNDVENVGRDLNNLRLGFSVRCVRDAE